MLEKNTFIFKDLSNATYSYLAFRIFNLCKNFQDRLTAVEESIHRKQWRLCNTISENTGKVRNTGIARPSAKKQQHWQNKQKIIPHHTNNGEATVWNANENQAR